MGIRRNESVGRKDDLSVKLKGVKDWLGINWKRVFNNSVGWILKKFKDFMKFVLKRKSVG